MTHVIPLKGGWRIELHAGDDIQSAEVRIICAGVYFSMFGTLTDAMHMRHCIRAQQEGEPLTSGDVD